MIYKCDYCGKEMKISPSRSKNNTICCSIECTSNLKKSKTKLNIVCPICKKFFHKKPSHITKENCCSKKCLGKLREEIYKGENNPNYGINEGNKRINQNGYIFIKIKDHPFANCDNCILEHRLIAEQFLLDDNNYIIINNKKYLSPDYDVHHKDMNKQNNDPNNLLILTTSEHMKLHHKLNKE